MDRFYTLKDGTKLVVREARTEDAEPLRDFYLKVTSETDYLITLPEEVRNVSAERYLIDVYNRESRRLYLVGIVGSKIVAILKFAAMSRKRMRHSGEMSLAVLKDFWGRGIGSVLMRELLDWARSVGIERIELSVVNDNLRAIKLYEKFGFTLEGIKRKAVKTEKGYSDLLLMAKIL